MSGRSTALLIAWLSRYLKVAVAGCGLLVLLASSGCAAEEFAGRVRSVEDGDSVRIERGVGDVRVRIFGVDAPESDQAYGPEAREVARGLLLNRTVRVSKKDVDQYGRLVAELSIDGQDIGSELIRLGAAWNYVQFSQDARYAALEADARAARRGLWALPGPTAPWLFRAAGRTTAAGPAASRPPVSGAMHGNRNSRVFHAPGCENYDCANCTEVFDSADAAAAAGFRPHAVCVR